MVRRTSVVLVSLLSQYFVRSQSPIATFGALCGGDQTTRASRICSGWNATSSFSRNGTSVAESLAPSSSNPRLSSVLSETGVEFSIVPSIPASSSIKLPSSSTGPSISQITGVSTGSSSTSTAAASPITNSSSTSPSADATTTTPNASGIPASLNASGSLTSARPSGSYVVSNSVQDSSTSNLIGATTALSTAPASPSLITPGASLSGTSTVMGSQSPLDSSKATASLSEGGLTNMPGIPLNPSATSSGGTPPPFITITDIAFLTIPTVGSGTTSNTAISTSDETHPPGLYPFIHGGSSCFFCPPGIDNGGFVLWGMNKPGVYPPPVPPPISNVPWPTITIGSGLVPTAGPKPQPGEPGNPEQTPSQQKSSETLTSSQSSSGCITTTASSCDVACSTPSGQSTTACSTTCQTFKGCTVTNVVSTTSQSGACSPLALNAVPSGDFTPSGKDNGEIEADPTYTGSVPIWVSSWPAPSASSKSPTSSTVFTPTPTSVTAPVSRNTAPPSSNTPPPPQATGPKAECETCSSDMGASSCGAGDAMCFDKECSANKHCQACGITDCLSYFGYVSLAMEADSVVNIVRPTSMSSKLSRRNALKPSIIDHILDTRNRLWIQKRAGFSKTWEYYTPRGLKYFKSIGDTPLKDTDESKACELDAYFELKKNGPTSAHEGGELVEMVGITPDKSYYSLQAKGPVKGQSKNGEADEMAVFQNTMSASQGIFLALFNDRQALEVTDPVTPYHFSTAAWWQWKKVVMAGQNPPKSEEETDFSNIRYFFRVNIINEDTTDIIDEALNGETGPISFDPEDESNNNAFWPLLGSPNGNGIAFFLSEHKKSLNSKTISKLTVWSPGARKYYMWATIV